MRHYAVFFILALFLHGLLLLPFLIRWDQKQPLTGGGGGGSISIMVNSLPSSDTGRQVVQDKRPQMASRGSFDRGRAPHIGSSHGRSAGPGIGAGSSEDGWNEILAKIRQRIERSKRYPLMARRRGLEGRTDVTFHIKKDGSVAELSLVHTAGTSILDREALATIRRAAPFPYYPEPIRIGIRFALKEEKD